VEEVVGFGDDDGGLFYFFAPGYDGLWFDDFICVALNLDKAVDRYIKP